jgi:hypothetical protein
VELEQLSLYDRLEIDAEKQRKGDKNYVVPQRMARRDPYPQLLNQAFNFYNVYVQMNMAEKERYAESQAVAFYRSCVCELEEKGKVLEQEISIIRDLSLKYMTEGNAMKEKAKESEQKEREMKEETIKLQERLEEDKRKAVQAVREETEALVGRY